MQVIARLLESVDIFEHYSLMKFVYNIGDMYRVERICNYYTPGKPKLTHMCAYIYIYIYIYAPIYGNTHHISGGSPCMGSFPMYIRYYKIIKHVVGHSFLYQIVCVSLCVCLNM
jgi:hypothetical protein